MNCDEMDGDKLRQPAKSSDFLL